MFSRTILAFALLSFTSPAAAQHVDSATARGATRLIEGALRDSVAYQRLGRLVDGFGHRMSGSRSLERAIDWIVAEMRKDGFDVVRTQPASVTNWVRGAESATLISPRAARLHMLGLGRSVGTTPRGITAPVLVVRDFAELRSRATEARGKIVVFNFPFDTTVEPFVGYSAAVRYRGLGADSARAVGAVAVLVRSVTSHSLRTAHTGSLIYGDSTRRIPAAAISVEDAMMLQRMQDRGERAVVRLVMGARTMPNARSRNVIAELRGSERPDEVVVIGGHIDSWDVGQGAMDDGGGSVAAWEALRLMKELGLRPKRTVRVVLWTNEEIGLGGARAYADSNRATIEKHVLAMESDAGVFRPYGITFAGSDSGLAVMRRITPLLRAIGADSVEAGSAEPDVGPLRRMGVPTAGIAVDASRYFWYHHSEADMLDKLNPREMAQCVAVMAVIAYAVANMDAPIPRPEPVPAASR